MQLRLDFDVLNYESYNYLIFNCYFMKKLVLLFLMLLAYVGINAQNPGDLDVSFADNGILKMAVSNSFDEPYSMLVQPDRKIITVGRARMDAKNYSIYVSRHLSDG